MLSRWIYTVKLCWKFRKQLYVYGQNEGFVIPGVVDLELSHLDDDGIRGLILDFDGVLAAHAELVPDSNVLRWLEKCVQRFESGNIFILSNKPMFARQEFFAKYFPEITFIVAKRKKPYSEGIKQILDKTKLSTRELLLIDDRLVTGIVAAEANSIKGCLVIEPIHKFKQRPIRETFFCVLRWLERKILL